MELFGLILLGRSWLGCLGGACFLRWSARKLLRVLVLCSAGSGVGWSEVRGSVGFSECTSGCVLRLCVWMWWKDRVLHGNVTIGSMDPPGEGLGGF